MVYLVGSPSHKNLAACVSVLLAQTFGKLRRTLQPAVDAPKEEQDSREQHHHPRTRAEQLTQQARQAERLARYEQIMTLVKQGMKSADIAAQMGMTERTVRRWLSRGDIPYSGSRRPRPSFIDPYKTYLLSRWHQGAHQGAQLERELRARGYKGSGRALYRYLETLESSSFSPRMRDSASATRQTVSKEPNPLLTLSAPRATWLFFRRPEDLKKEERETLQQLRQVSPHLEVAYQLVETFLNMVREHTGGEQFEAWLAEIQASHLEAFQSFVTGVQQDKDAVLAGLSLPWSNGPLEGNVNRLKLIKRSMYGRAELDLLKLRVLHHSKKSQERKNKKQGQQVVQLKKPTIMKNGPTSQHTTTGISKVA